MTNPAAASESLRKTSSLICLLVFGCLPMAARDLIRIPAQSYDGVDENTGIQVHIQIDSFLMPPTETTEQEFEVVTGSNPAIYRGTDLPVENVSWWDAIRYCNLRSIKEHLDPCYDLSTGKCDRTKNGYRLPTEAEWTLAAAEGAKSTNVHQFAALGSSNTKDVDALLQLVRKGPRPVAQYLPNRQGLYDMLGNVWEWCQDFFDSVIVYPRATNPDGPDSGIARVVRGGSFATSVSSWSKGYRSSLAPGERSRFTGFRVCRTDSVNVKSAATEANANWFKPYQEAPAGFEKSTGNLSPLLRTGTSRAASRKQWEEQVPALKQKWEKLLGSCPANLASPGLRVLHTNNGSGYRGTLAELQVEPDAWEDIYIMKPSRPAAHPLPVVIVPFYDVDPAVGSDMGGRRYTPPGVRSFALLAVQRGYIAVAIRWFGESYGESYAEAVANLAIRHPDCSGMGKWVSDARQLVNYLTTLPDVDPTRIAIMGHSLGGKMALYAGAFDSRIAVTVASEPGIGFSHSNYGDYWYFGHRLDAAPSGTDQHELLGMMAPRPFLLIGGDKFDGKDSWYYINAARPVYDLFGKPNNIGFLDHHQGHSPTPEAAWRAMEFLRHFLE